MTAQTAVYVGVASSIAPQRHIPAGLRALDEVAPVLVASPFLRTPALGRPQDPDFVNGVVRVAPTLDPLQLKEHLRAIESSQGRRRGPDPHAPRTLDLDLLLYGGLSDAALGLPNPDLQRPFVAACLLALDPDIRTPDGQSLQAPRQRFPIASGTWWPVAGLGGRRVNL